MTVRVSNLAAGKLMKGRQEDYASEEWPGQVLIFTDTYS
jgi:hypothetical protein